MTQQAPPFGPILLVEREKLDVHRTRAFVDRRRDPQYVAGGDVTDKTDDVIVAVLVRLLAPMPWLIK